MFVVGFESHERLEYYAAAVDLIFAQDCGVGSWCLRDSEVVRLPWRAPLSTAIDLPWLLS